MSANVLGVGCYSNPPVSAYTASTGCQRAVTGQLTPETVTFTWNNVVIAGADYRAPVTSGGPVTPRTTTIDPSDSSLYTGLTQVPMVTLVHRAEDFSGGGQGSGASTTSSTSAASVGMLDVHSGIVGAVLGLWILLVSFGL